MLLFSSFIFLFKIIFTNAQLNYFKTIQTDFTQINSTFSTVVISESRDLGVCSCDLTPNACDYQCCCDTECPTSIITLWISDPNNVCLDKSKLKIKK